MCTILTVSRPVFDDSPNVFLRQIEEDFLHNPDGFSLLLWSEDLQQFSQVRGFDLSLLLYSIECGSWDRMWLHQRMATQGEPRLEYCHGWNSRGVHFMHNGILTDPSSRKLPVDSMLIGHWLKEHGLDGTSDRLVQEPFANVFLIESDGFYRTHASTSGRLHTDGRGNYSTNPVGTLTRKLEGPCYFEHFPQEDLPLPEEDSEYLDGKLDDWGGRLHEQSYYSDMDPDIEEMDLPEYLRFLRRGGAK